MNNDLRVYRKQQRRTRRGKGFDLNPRGLIRTE
jgi:hypothetical protein